MQKQTRVILTGATSGIGRQTATELANLGYHLILGNRNQEKANQVKEEILKQYPATKIDLYSIDLSSFASILEFTKQIKQNYESIDILINNAGVLTRKRAVSKEGFELTMAVNHLGTYLLTKSLVEAYQEIPLETIIMVSSIGSYWGTVSIKKNMFKRNRNPFQNYFDSKLANLIYIQELSLMLKEKGTKVLAADPGVVYSHIWKWHTKFGRSLDKLQQRIMKSSQEGAKSILRLVTGDYPQNTDCVLFSLTKPRKLPKKIRNKEVQERYMKETARIVEKTLEEQSIHPK